LAELIRVVPCPLLKNPKAMVPWLMDSKAKGMVWTSCVLFSQGPVGEKGPFSRVKERGAGGNPKSAATRPWFDRNASMFYDNMPKLSGPAYQVGRLVTGILALTGRS